jgi:hypothetical protein
MVILAKTRKAALVETRFVVSLHEEAALVRVDLQLDQNDSPE